MKKIYACLTSLFLLFFLSVNTASAQVGPSDATTAPPTNAGDVGKVLCFGQNISITGPQDASNTDFTKYHWYKIDAGGNKVLTSQTGRTYTENTTTAGYYNYQVVTENANGCESPISDVFKIYMLPQLTATVIASLSSICTTVGTTVLTANPTPATGYTLTYQWTRNGANITDATGSTYTVTGETTAGPVTFGVNIAYTLNSSCTVTATKEITIVPLPSKPSISAN